MRAGVVLLPGIGFDVVPTDCLALELKERLPDTTHLDLAFVAEGGGWSRGTLATMIESLPHAGAMRRNGRIVPLPLAAETMAMDLPVGRRTVMSIAWGDARPLHPPPASQRDLHRRAEREVQTLRKVEPLLPIAGSKTVSGSCGSRSGDGRRPQAFQRHGAHLDLGDGARCRRRQR